MVDLLPDIEKQYAIHDNCWEGPLPTMITEDHLVWLIKELKTSRDEVKSFESEWGREQELRIAAEDDHKATLKIIENMKLYYEVHGPCGLCTPDNPCHYEGR